MHWQMLTFVNFTISGCYIFLTYLCLKISEHSQSLFASNRCKFFYVSFHSEWTTGGFGLVVFQFWVGFFFPNFIFEGEITVCFLKTVDIFHRLGFFLFVWVFFVFLDFFLFCFFFVSL